MLEWPQVSKRRPTTAELDSQLKESYGSGAAWLIGLLTFAIMAASHPENFPGETEWYLASPFLAAILHYGFRASRIQRRLRQRQAAVLAEGEGRES